MPTKRARDAGAVARQRLGKRMRSTRRNVTRSRYKVSRNCHLFRRFCNDVRQNCIQTTQSFTIEYKFQDMINYGDFTELYDRYMITCVVHKFRLVNNPNATAGHNWPADGTFAVFNRTNWYPKLWYCKDYDDSSGETLQELQQRANTKCLVLQPNKQYKVVLRPAVTIQTYRTAASTGYAPKWKQWIDMAQTNVPHYGLKCLLDCSAQEPQDNYPFILEYTTQIFFKCKDVR